MMLIFPESPLAFVFTTSFQSSGPRLVTVNSTFASAGVVGICLVLSLAMMSGVLLGVQCSSLCYSLCVDNMVSVTDIIRESFVWDFYKGPYFHSHHL